MSYEPQYKFVIRFVGLDSVKGKVKRFTKDITTYAVDAHRAIDNARAVIAENVKLRTLHFPAYCVKHMGE